MGGRGWCPRSGSPITNREQPVRWTSISISTSTSTRCSLGTVRVPRLGWDCCPGSDCGWDDLSMRPTSGSTRSGGLCPPPPPPALRPRASPGCPLLSALKQVVAGHPAVAGLPRAWTAATGALFAGPRRSVRQSRAAEPPSRRAAEPPSRTLLEDAKPPDSVIQQLEVLGYIDGGEGVVP